MTAGTAQTSVTPAIQGGACVLEENLRDLNVKIGNTFLGLGTALQSISARSREITTLSRSTVALTATKDSEQMVKTLHTVLSDTERVLDLTDTSNRQLREILCCLQRARLSLAALAQLPDVLNAVRILWTIEGGRLQDTAVDVSSLAADIAALKQEVESNVNGMVDEATRLTDLVVSGAQRLRITEMQEREEATGLIQYARSVVGALQAKAESSQKAASRIEEQYVAIRDAIDKIVLLLQSEDIARQRMEHIAKALQQASLASESGELAEQYVTVLALQRSQLLDVRDFLVTSICSIADSLRSLVPRVEALTHETAALASETDESGRSLKTDIEQGLVAVSSVLEPLSVSARAVVTTVDNVVPALAGMAKSAQILSGVEKSIRIIAINAAIKTSQVGEQGESIGILARKLQNANAQSEGQTRGFLEALQGIEHALALIAKHGIDKESRLLDTAAVRVVHAEINSLLSVVLQAGRDLAAQLGSLLAMSQELRDEIEGACRVASQAAETTEKFDSVMSILDGSLAQAGGPISSELPRASKEAAAALATTYSMESQRKVHRTVVGSSLDESTPGAANENSDLGDNVELF